MKLLFINAPIRLDAAPNCIPYGLAIVASIVRHHGHQVEIYDVNALRPEFDTIKSKIAENQWDIIGVSGLVTTYKFQKWLIAELKLLQPEAVIVSGGGLATSCSHLLFRHSPVDVTVIGEGEKTFLRLLQAIENKVSFDHVAGICFRKNREIITTAKRENINNLNEIPFPAWDLLPMEIYLRNPIWGKTAGNSSGFIDDYQPRRSMNIISSRGCPFSCHFCYNLFGCAQHRFRSASHIVQEIESLISLYHVDFIGFVDDNMLVSHKRMNEFLDILKHKKINIQWGCHGRVTNLNPEILAKMADAGCVWIGFGIESGSQKILDLMNKKATVNQARQAIKMTRAAGIYANTTFIFGYPGETLETIQETISFKREMQLDCGSFFATPYPGTQLYEQFGHLIGDEDLYLDSLNNATDFSINLTQFDDDTFFKLKQKMDLNEDVI